MAVQSRIEQVLSSNNESKRRSARLISAYRAGLTPARQVYSSWCCRDPAGLRLALASNTTAADNTIALSRKDSLHVVKG